MCFELSAHKEPDSGGHPEPLLVIYPPDHQAPGRQQPTPLTGMKKTRCHMDPRCIFVLPAVMGSQQNIMFWQLKMDFRLFYSAFPYTLH